MNPVKPPPLVIPYATPDIWRTQPRVRNDPFAVGGILLGLLVCVPFLTGGMAVVCGIIVVRNTKATRDDRAIGIVAIALGILSVGAWLLGIVLGF